MGLFSKLLNVGIAVVNTAIEEGMKKQGQMYKEAERRYNKQTGNPMPRNSSGQNGQQIKNPFLIGDKTLEQWERSWQSIGTLCSLNLTPYNHSVGVYRARLGGQVVYIGRAVEWNNGGFRKRLSDYTRDSESARHHGSGQKMYLNRNNLQIDIIITGSDEKGAEIAKDLEMRLIIKYTPEWNVKLK